MLVGEEEGGQTQPYGPPLSEPDLLKSGNFVVDLSSMTHIKQNEVASSVFLAVGASVHLSPILFPAFIADSIDDSVITDTIVSLAFQRSLEKI